MKHLLVLLGVLLMLALGAQCLSQAAQSIRQKRAVEAVILSSVTL